MTPPIRLERLIVPLPTRTFVLAGASDRITRRYHVIVSAGHSHGGLAVMADTTEVSYAVFQSHDWMRAIWHELGIQGSGIVGFWYEDVGTAPQLADWILTAYGPPPSHTEDLSCIDYIADQCASQQNIPRTDIDALIEALNQHRNQHSE